MESIEIYRRVFLATYTIEASDGIFGYTKICTERPPSVWETARAVLKVASGPSAGVLEAHDRAQLKARDRIDALIERHGGGRA